MDNTNLKDYTGKSRGLGDSIHKFARLTGLNNLAQLGAKAVGKKDCGCKKRQETLNNAFPYKNK
tara:strand:- start:513 stop:704 length:192 start_codon:yes stop_codon:yes gene_type:complete